MSYKSTFVRVITASFALFKTFWTRANSQLGDMTARAGMRQDRRKKDRRVSNRRVRNDLLTPVFDDYRVQRGLWNQKKADSNKEKTINKLNNDPGIGKSDLSGELAILKSLLLNNIAGSLYFSALYYYADPICAAWMWNIVIALIYAFGLIFVQRNWAKYGVAYFSIAYILVHSFLNFYVLPVNSLNYLFLLMAPSGMLLFFELISNRVRIFTTLSILGLILFLLLKDNHVPAIRLSDDGLLLVRTSVIVIFFTASLHLFNAYLTTIRRLQNDLRTTANIDWLSGIFTRRAFFHFGELLINDVKADGRTFGIIISDIDWFKKINDSHGHQTGDQVISYVAETMLEMCPANTILARYGGEEFVMLVIDEEQKNITALAESIRQKIARSPFSNGKKSLSVTMSFGTAIHNGDESLEDVIAHADQALYQAKQAGRNQVISYSHSLASLKQATIPTS